MLVTVWLNTFYDSLIINLSTIALFFAPHFVHVLYLLGAEYFWPRLDILIIYKRILVELITPRKAGLAFHA